jgi:hypothetical protein
VWWVDRFRVLPPFCFFLVPTMGAVGAGVVRAGFNCKRGAAVGAVCRGADRVGFNTGAGGA